MKKLKCFKCNCEVAKDHYVEEADKYVCDDCYADLCAKCHVEPCEVETRQGDYICTSCYSAACDHAYEMWKDRD